MIKNSTAFEPTLTSEIFDMVAGTGTGSTAFDYVPVGDAPRGAGAWVRPVQPARIRIPAFQQAEIDIVVDVPPDAGAGGHYAGVLFKAPDPRPDAEAAFEIQQFIPLFLTVHGEFERDVRVVATPTDRWLWSGGLASWDVRIRNEGDVHEPVAGRVRLDGLIGGTRSVRLEPAILLPGEERTQRVRFDLRSAPDLLRAHARVDLDDEPSVRDDAPSVVVLPLWVLVLLAVAVLVVVLRLRSRRHRPTGYAEFSTDDEWIDPSG